jgi:omega-hydroxy-beta-dihydromenaquinone-9 sulfotransferase
MITGLRPQRHLALHRAAWTAIRQLLRESGVSVPASVRMFYGWRAHLLSAGWQMLSRTPTASPSVAMFVCGFWRSGTTLLHECLSQDSRWRAPTTQECMNPGQPQPTTPTRTMKRPMDNIQVSGSSPQEDEFALLALGAPSLYRMLLCPSAWPGLLRQLEAGPADPSWTQREQTLREFVTYLQSRDERPLILKSPTHSFHLARLLDAFPDSRAVIILRDWDRVVASSIRMWSSMFESYAVARWDRGEIVDLTVAALQGYCRQIALQVPTISRARVAAIRYADLARRPVQTLRSLYAHFDLDFPEGNAESVRAFAVRTSPGAPTDIGGSKEQMHLDGAGLATAYEGMCEVLAPYLVTVTSQDDL